MEGLPDLHISGLNELRQQIIVNRWRIIETHLSPWFPPASPWYVTLCALPHEHERVQMIEILENTVTSHSLWKTIIGGQQDTTWQEYVLLPLVSDLGFYQAAVRGIVLSCRGRGCFDRIVASRHQPERPNIEEILQAVSAVLTDHTTREARADALVQRTICRDWRRAYDVAGDLKDANIKRQAFALLYGLLGMYSTYGPIGLLHLTEDTAATELFALERYRQHLAALTNHPDSVLAEVRRDLIALHDGIRGVERSQISQQEALLLGSGSRNGRRKGAPRLWQPHLLEEPLNSAARREYDRRLWPRLRGYIAKVVAARRDCDITTAADLFNLLIRAGLPGLIDLHCQAIGGSAQHAIDLQRTLDAVTRATAGLAVWAQQECERLIRCLLTAIQEIGLPLSLKPLILDYPSSIRRIRWGRRLWFGIPATMRRRQRRRRKFRQKQAQSTRKTQSSHLNKKYSVQGDRVVARFAELAQLDETDARNRLRWFISYGLLGLLPREQWYIVLDERVISWLWLLKLGRLDGTIHWPTVVATAKQYGQVLGIPCPAPQIMRAIFNSLPKPRYWHGGKGKAVQTVRQRATLSLIGRPRLHRAWIILVFSITLEINKGQPRTYFLLLVVDEGSQLTVGGWLSETKPGLRELGLALYQSIWHPEIIDWPVRGIPEIVRIPSELMTEEIKLIDTNAVQLLQHLARVSEEQPENKERANELRHQLLKDQSHIKYALSGTSPPMQQALRWLAGDDPESVEELAIPQTWLSEQLRNLDRAATFLLTRMEVVDRTSLEGKAIIRGVRDELRKQASQIVSDAFHGPTISLGAALRALLMWVREKQFPNHRQATLPDSIARYGVGMSGHKTLAAGWLLPEVEATVSAETGSVVWQSRRYSGLPLEVADPTNIKAHAYPYVYSRRSLDEVEPGVFAKASIGDKMQLIYLDCVS